MARTLRFVAAFCIILFSASAAHAVTLTFENFAPTGGVVNINPGSPYTESGFTISVTNPLAAVVDSAAPADMAGNLTDFFAFDTSNTATLTFTGATFDLASLLIGPYALASPPPINMVIVGTLAGGGTLTATFTGLTTATTANLNWVGLQSVRFNNTSAGSPSAGGLDDIVVTSSAAVPEVESLTLLALGLFSIVVAGTRQRRRQA
jgi:hypothetical protein